ncbi:MAG TPA: zf-HC2 domain-containing protein, partial [Bacillota bacterium]|nr:zf-HC2 domain-containing protein [Bacillota bacterium]
MKHCNFSELISSYIDGELDPQASAQLEEHLKVCPDCKAMYEELRHIKKLLGSVSEIEPPDSLHISIMEAVNEEAIRREDALRAERSAKRSMWLRRLSIALAACLIILVVSPAVKSTFFGSQQLPRDVTPEIGEKQEETITADNTETEEEGTLVFGSQPQQPEPSVGNGQKQEDVQPPSEKSPSDVTASSEDNELLASDATSGVPEEEISEGDEATEFFMATKRTAANIAKQIKSANIAIEVPQGVLGDVSDKACA